MRVMKILVMLIVAALFLTSCAKMRPVVYPQDANAGATKAEIDRAIRECEEIARTGGSDFSASGDAAADVATNTGTSAAHRAANSAIYGGNVGASVASGSAHSAISSIGSSLRRSRQPDAAHRSIMSRCLRDKGYDVVGWS